MADVIKLSIKDYQPTLRLDSYAPIDGGITNHSQLVLDDGTNPHGTTKSDVGLGNVPNTDFTNAVNANTAKVSFPEALIDGKQYARKNGAWVEVVSGGASAVPIIKPNAEILATSKTQIIPLYGFDLHKVVSIALTNGSAISYVIESSSLIWLTVTMNATVGLKTLTVNGTIVYTNWIKADVNAGYEYLGSGDGHILGTYGIDETTDLRISNVVYTPLQTATGIKPFEINGWQSYIGFTKYAINKNETIDVILSTKVVAINQDWLRFFLLKKSDTVSGGITAGNKDGYNIATRGHLVTKDTFLGDTRNKYAAIVETFCKNFSNGDLNRASVNGNFAIGVMEATNPKHVRIRINNEGTEIYSLDNRNDVKGKLIYKHIASSDCQLQNGELYTFFFCLYYGTLANKNIDAEIVAIRKS